MRIAPKIELNESERATLESYARGRSTPTRLVIRAKIVLRAARGMLSEQIAKELHIGPKTVCLWRTRFAKLRLPGIEKDAPGRGRPRKFTTERVNEIVRMTTQETPPNATQWSTRDMAKAAGVSPATVQRLWKAHGLKPHRVRTFKLSNDPNFVEKLEDVVGLYMNPPAHALVFSLDEKSQIQALDRTQQALPFQSGYALTMTHDYIRNGTTTLFAALNTLSGEVLSMCSARHTHTEWLSFLKLIDASTPKDREIHLIADNYATHKHAKVKRWLEKHPRFHMHFTPTGSSWLNMVERFFRDITTKRIRRGTFRSVKALIEAIQRYIAEHNIAPKPFIWTAKARDILEKVKRARKARDNSPSV